MNNISISIPEWHRMAEQGKTVPVRILINGDSMYPLIRMNRDYVTIVPMDGEPFVGEIVLFSDPGRKRYVLHRVWKLRNGEALTWGDNFNHPDGWIPRDAIWGKAVLVEKDGKRIVPDPKSGMRKARAWHAVGPGFRWSVGKARTIYHRLVKKGKKG